MSEIDVLMPEYYSIFKFIVLVVVLVLIFNKKKKNG